MGTIIARRLAAIAILFAAVSMPASAQQNAAGVPEVVEATTAGGEKVLLHPNGRWEYVNTAKAADAKKVADTFPENHTRPVDAQGCWFGIGRCIMPGDKDYNRGSLGRH
jgi:hypothetical protein